MPLTLSSPQAVNQTLDTLEINSFAVDIEAQQIHVAYDEGYIDADTFIPVLRDKMITISGADFAASLAEADAANTGSVYGDLKTALYSRLMAVTGFSGNGELMPTEVIRTLAPSGGDYTTIAAWEAAQQSGAWVTNDQIPVLEIAAGDYTAQGGGVNQILEKIIISGWSDVDATRRPTIRAAAGVEHGGISGAGLVIQAPVNTVVETSYPLSMTALEIRAAGNYGAIVGGTNVLFDRMIIRAYSYSNVVQNLQSSIIRNTLVLSAESGDCVSIFANNQVYNCVLIGGDIALGSNYHVDARNNVAFGQSVNSFVMGAGSLAANNAAYNGTTASDAVDAGILPFDVVSSDFVDAAGGDYRLSAGSQLIGKGTNLVDQFNRDIDGTSRYPKPYAWDIGFHQYLKPIDNSKGGIFLPSKFVREPALLIPGRKPLGPVVMTKDNPFNHPTGLLYSGGVLNSAIKGVPPDHIVNSDGGLLSTPIGTYEIINNNDYYRLFNVFPPQQWSMFLYGKPAVSATWGRDLIGFCEVPGSGTKDRSIRFNSSGGFWEGYLYDGAQRRATSSVVPSSDRFDAVLLVANGSTLEIFINGKLESTSPTTSGTHQFGFQSYHSPEFVIGFPSSTSLAEGFVFDMLGLVHTAIPEAMAKKFTANPYQFLKPAGGAW